MRNIVIDRGNTRTKAGVYDDAKKIFEDSIEGVDVEHLMRLSDEFQCKRCIISSVAQDSPETYSLLKNNMEKFVYLDEKTPLPLENLYSTPATLGRDRIAACVGANSIKPNQNILVIDVGTAVTYDIVNSKNQYVGGNISLGLEMRAEALHTFTARLPRVEVESNVNMYGTTTKSAIQSGIMLGLEYEIKGYIDRISNFYPCLSVFLTGGHSFFFENKLKSAIFAKDLLLLGLNHILNYR